MQSTPAEQAYQTASSPRQVPGLEQQSGDRLDSKMVSGSAEKAYDGAKRQVRSNTPRQQQHHMDCQDLQEELHRCKVMEGPGAHL